MRSDPVRIGPPRAQRRGVEQTPRLPGGGVLAGNACGGAHPQSQSGVHHVRGHPGGEARRPVLRRRVADECRGVAVLAGAYVSDKIVY